MNDKVVFGGRSSGRTFLYINKIKEENNMNINTSNNNIDVRKPTLNRYERAMKMLEEDMKITNDSFIVIKYKDNDLWKSSKIFFKNRQDWKYASISVIFAKRHNRELNLYEDILKYASDYDRVVILKLEGNENVYIDEETIFKIEE